MNNDLKPCCKLAIERGLITSHPISWKTQVQCNECGRLITLTVTGHKEEADTVQIREIFFEKGEEGVINL